MATWHVDMWGVVDDSDKATAAAKAVVDTAKSHGLTSGYVQTPALKADVSDKGLPKVAKASEATPVK